MGVPAQNGIRGDGTPNAGDQANAAIFGTITAVGPTQPWAFRGPMNAVLWESYNTALTTTAGSTNASVAAAGSIAAGAAINSVTVVPGTTVKSIAGNNIVLALPPLTLHGYIQSNGQLTLPPASSGVGVANQLIGATVTLPSNKSGITLPAGTTVLSVLQAMIPANAASNYPGQSAILQLSNPPGNLPTIVTFGVPFPQDQFQFALTGAGIVTTGADANATFTSSVIEYNGSVQLERSFDGGNTWIVCNIGGSGTLAVYSTGTPVSLVFGEPEKEVLYRFNCTSFTAVGGSTLNYRISQTGGAAESLAIGPLSSG